MCRFKSGIILRNRVVVAPGDNDSHSDLLESLGIDDSYINATKTFVRAELIPEEWWVSPEEHPEKWKFVVDQDIIPGWFNQEESEKVFREAVCTWWKIHVLVDQKIDELRSGFYRLKCCKVKKLCNNVNVLLHNSQVGIMYDNSKVNYMYDSYINKMLHNSKVDNMYGNSRINKMFTNSKVNKMSDSSQVNKMSNESIAKDFKNYPNIKILISKDGKFEMVVHN